MEITLDQLLAARDRRWQLQQKLLHDNPAMVPVCLTIVMPGSVKRNKESLIAAHAAVEALKSSFDGSIAFCKECDLPTGYEAYLLINQDAAKAKEIACTIEESHPLGRLFDIDVIGKDGIPLSRSSVGVAARRCLLCNNEARYCMRNHSHSIEELQKHISQMIDDYVHRV